MVIMPYCVKKLILPNSFVQTKQHVTVNGILDLNLFPSTLQVSLCVCSAVGFLDGLVSLVSFLVLFIS